jgi:hypothetical protein
VMSEAHSRRHCSRLYLAMTTLIILPSVGRKTSAPRTCLTDSHLYLPPVSRRTGLQHHNQTHAPQQTIMAAVAAAVAAAAAVEAAAVVAAAEEEAAVEAEEEVVVVVVAARVAPSAASCWRPSGWNC